MMAHIIRAKTNPKYCTELSFWQGILSDSKSNYILFLLFL